MGHVVGGHAGIMLAEVLLSTALPYRKTNVCFCFSLGTIQSLGADGWTEGAPGVSGGQTVTYGSAWVR